jgi:hypothetical protein
MDPFSIWHELGEFLPLIVIFTASYFFMRHKGGGTPPPAAAGVHLFSPTQYISASLHTGEIDPQTVIDRLEDRHKARLPELGLNTARLLTEAKRARLRRDLFSVLALVVPIALVFPLVALVRALAGGNGGPSGTLLWLLALPLVAMMLLGITEELAVNRYLRTRVVPTVDPPDDTAKQNVVIYGGFSPFAGYGGDLEGWSFVIDASRPPEGHATPPQRFDLVDLLNHISKQLEANVVLGDSYDKLFVNGRRVRDQKLFLHDATAIPNTVISGSIMKARVGLPDDHVRHYRLFSVPFGSGHLTLTCFFRATLVGDNLFFELSCFVLSPVKAAYTTLNDLPVRRGLRYSAGLVARHALAAPLAWLRGPMFLLVRLERLQAFLVEAVFGDREDKLKRRQPTYNYGQFTSLRESWASGLYHSYYQKLDQDMIYKSCQHVIVDAIVDFLGSKGISTDEIKARSSVIFNAGVMISGGVVNAQQIAVGDKATVKNAASQARTPAALSTSERKA